MTKNNSLLKQKNWIRLEKNLVYRQTQMLRHSGANLFHVFHWFVQLIIGENWRCVCTLTLRHSSYFRQRISMLQVFPIQTFINRCDFGSTLAIIFSNLKNFQSQTKLFEIFSILKQIFRISLNPGKINKKFPFWRTDRFNDLKFV